MQGLRRLYTVLQSLLLDEYVRCKVLSLVRHIKRGTVSVGATATCIICVPTSLCTLC